MFYHIWPWAEPHTARRTYRRILDTAGEICFWHCNIFKGNRGMASPMQPDMVPDLSLRRGNNLLFSVETQISRGRGNSRGAVGVHILWLGQIALENRQRTFCRCTIVYRDTSQKVLAFADGLANHLFSLRYRYCHCSHKRNPG